MLAIDTNAAYKNKAETLEITIDKFKFALLITRSKSSHYHAIFFFKMVRLSGIEPETQGFSVLCST